MIKRGYDKTNKKFQEQFGFKLFLDLGESDKHLLKTTHVLLTEEQAEFDQQISNLAKLFVEYLNKSDLEKNTKWKPESESENKSLNYLQHFLEENFEISSSTLKEIMNGFRMIQLIRSKSSAHAKSSNYEEYVKKVLDLDTYSIKKSHFKLVNLLFNSLKNIHQYT